MTVSELEDALVEFVAQNTWELRFRSNEQTNETVPPFVWSGFIPRDEVGAVLPGEITTYPAIIVNARNGEQTGYETGEKVTVNFLIGCFDDTLTQQGYRDCANLLQRVKDRIREVDIIRERFPWRPPLRWQINAKYGGGAGANNSFPYFFAELQVDFELPVMVSQYDDTAVTGDIMTGRYDEVSGLGPPYVEHHG